MASNSRYLTAGSLSSTSGQVDIDLKTGSFTLKGPSGTTVIGDLEKGDVVARFDAGPAIEPLRFAGVTLYGDLASSLRELQQILSAHGAGELIVVKTNADSQGRLVAAGINLGAEPQGFDQITESVAASIGSLNFKIADPADQIRQVIREELKPGGMLHCR